MIVAETLSDQFFEQGYFGPLAILSEAECQNFVDHASNSAAKPPLDWGKGHACNSRAFYEIATHPVIMEVVTTLLGKDVLLWGASIPKKAPGAIHGWHSDIETAGIEDKSISVWIGIKNTARDSSLQIISHSHRFNVTVQESRHLRKKSREDVTQDDIIGWAQELNHQCRLVVPEITNGQALFFDGRIWHGSRNLSGQTRWALLLQYATPDTAIRIPDATNVDWPFRHVPLPRPACVMVSGSAKAGVNRIVSAPVASDGGSTPQLTSRIFPLRIPLPPDEQSGWKAYPIFKGSTAGLKTLSCHASVLHHNQSPHPPHTHDHEQLLLLVSGEADLLLPDLPGLEANQRKHLKTGEMVYYPAHFLHSLETVSGEPANYMMLKWLNDSTDQRSALAFGHYRFSEYATTPMEKGCRSHLIFEGQTSYLKKLQCHTTTLAPGAGYDPHVDAYDVAIIVLEGEVETLEERVGPHGVIFYPAGEPHGMRNPGDAIARYVVFEFHGRTNLAAAEKISAPPRPFHLKLIDPDCWKRAFKTLAWRIKNPSRKPRQQM